MRADRLAQQAQSPAQRRDMWRRRPVLPRVALGQVPIVGVGQESPTRSGNWSAGAIQHRQNGNVANTTNDRIFGPARRAKPESLRQRTRDKVSQQDHPMIRIDVGPAGIGEECGVMRKTVLRGVLVRAIAEMKQRRAAVVLQRRWTDGQHPRRLSRPQVLTAIGEQELRMGQGRTECNEVADNPRTTVFPSLGKAAGLLLLEGCLLYTSDAADE